MRPRHWPDIFVQSLILNKWIISVQIILFVIILQTLHNSHISVKDDGKGVIVPEDAASFRVPFMLTFRPNTFNILLTAG